MMIQSTLLFLMLPSSLPVNTQSALTTMQMEMPSPTIDTAMPMGMPTPPSMTNGDDVTIQCWDQCGGKGGDCVGIQTKVARSEMHSWK